MGHFVGTHHVFAHYLPGQASSIIAVVVFAIISILAVGFFLLYVSWISLHRFLARRGVSWAIGNDRSFFQTQLGAYTVSLLLSNFLMCIAYIINTHWINLNHVERGALCMTQGILMEIAITANAYFTAAIGIHAFNSLVCRNRAPSWLCWLAVVVGWVTGILVGAIPVIVHTKHLGPIYGFNGLSCGVSLAYPVAQVLLQLLPGFIAAFVAIIFYVLIYLTLRGNIAIQHGVRVTLRADVRQSITTTADNDTEYYRFVLTIAKSLTWYPIAFIILSLPFVIVVLMRVMDNPVPFGLHVFSDTALGTLGLANAIILLNTLRLLSPYIKTIYSCDDIDADSVISEESTSSYASNASLATIQIPEKMPCHEVQMSGSLNSSAPFDPAMMRITPAPVARTPSARNKYSENNVQWPLPPIPVAQTNGTQDRQLWITTTSFSEADISAPASNINTRHNIRMVYDRNRDLPDVPPAVPLERSQYSFSSNAEEPLHSSSPLLPFKDAVSPPPLSAATEATAFPDMSYTQRDIAKDEIPNRQKSILGPYSRQSMDLMQGGQPKLPLSPSASLASLGPRGSRAASLASFASIRGLPANPKAFKSIDQQSVFSSLTKLESGHANLRLRGRAEAITDTLSDGGQELPLSVSAKRQARSFAIDILSPSLTHYGSPHDVLTNSGDRAGGIDNVPFEDT